MSVRCIVWVCVPVCYLTRRLSIIIAITQIQHSSKWAPLFPIWSYLCYTCFLFVSNVCKAINTSLLLLYLSNCMRQWWTHTGDCHHMPPITSGDHHISKGRGHRQNGTIHQAKELGGIGTVAVSARVTNGAQSNSATTHPKRQKSNKWRAWANECCPTHSTLACSLNVCVWVCVALFECVYLFVIWHGVFL